MNMNSTNEYIEIRKLYTNVNIGLNNNTKFGDLNIRRDRQIKCKITVKTDTCVK